MTNARPWEKYKPPSQQTSPPDVTPQGGKPWEKYASGDKPISYSPEAITAYTGLKAPTGMRAPPPAAPATWGDTLHDVATALAPPDIPGTAYRAAKGALTEISERPVLPTTEDVQAAQEWTKQQGLDPTSYPYLAPAASYASLIPQTIGRAVGYPFEVVGGAIEGAYGPRARREYSGILESEMGRAGEIPHVPIKTEGPWSKYKAPGQAIESPAIRDTSTGNIVTGDKHADIPITGEKGFTTTGGEFVDRTEGAKLAKEAGQVPEGFNKPLHSEDLSAAIAPKQSFPETPSKDMVSNLDDTLFRLRQSSIADKAELIKKVEGMPEELRNPSLQEKFHYYSEGDPSVELSPQERAAYDTYIKPLKQEETALFDKLTNYGYTPQQLDEPYARRPVKGMTPQFDEVLGVGSGSDPVFGYRSLPKTTSSLKERVFHALVNQYTGERKVVAVKGKSLYDITPEGEYVKIRGAKPDVSSKPRSSVLIKGDRYALTPYDPKTYSGSHPPDLVRLRGKQWVATPMKGVKYDKPIRPGTTVGIGKEKWRVDPAYTREIEAATDIEYHKNATANLVDNIARLRSVDRATAFAKAYIHSPEFEAYAKPVGAKAPPGWREVEMPTFKGYKIQPKLANVIDDFYGKKYKGDLAQALEAINHYATASLFWSPIPHALNAGAHWATARGWDWITPSGVKSLAVDSARAMREVITQGPKYRELLREGSGMLYSGVANKDFYELLMKRLGEDIRIQPHKWDPIAKVLGVGPSQLIKLLYGGSSRALWAASDMFMMQRVLELERKGMSTRAAIKEAEKHIPNYRVPPEILGSRAVSELLTNPLLTTFSRYHYGMMKSYAHMAKDLAIGNSKQKWEALGNIMATAALMTFIWPSINYGIQKLTGSKDLKLGPKGSTTIPQHLMDMWNGEKGPTEFLSSLVTVAPGLQTAAESFGNIDWFTGKRIREPADERALRMKRLAAQTAEHLMGNLVQPYGLLAQANKSGESVARALARQGLGLTDKSPEKLQKRAKAFRYQEDEAKRRKRKPQGPIEKLVYGLE